MPLSLAGIIRIINDVVNKATQQTELSRPRLLLICCSSVNKMLLHIGCLIHSIYLLIIRMSNCDGCKKRRWGTKRELGEGMVEEGGGEVETHLIMVDSYF